jgi:hypothetical protein
MESVYVFAMYFNSDGDMETITNRLTEVNDYNEYNDVVTVNIIPVPCKLDTVKITDSGAYLATKQIMKDYEGLELVLNEFKKYYSNIIKRAKERLDFLEDINIIRRD